MKQPTELIIENSSRRQFIQQFSLSGLVLTVGLPKLLLADEVASSAKANLYGADAMPHGWVDNPLVFIAIATDGTVSIVCHRSEMGQGIRTSLPMVVADELEADWQRVKVLQAPADEARYGNQDTDGSRSMRHFFLPMRKAGAAARTMLETAAAARWQVPISEVKAKAHQVIHLPSGKSLSYGELAQAAAALPLPDSKQLQLKTAEQFRYIGKGESGLYDGQAMVTGAAKYGIDTHFADLLYAVVARPPVFGGKLIGFDASETQKIPGVIKVLSLPSTAGPAEFNPLGGVAVIATNTWAAIQGRKALKIEWDHGPHASYDSNSYKTELETAARQPGKIVRDQGQIDTALATASRRISAEYYLPHLAQAPMEPPAATARLLNGHCEIWACTQGPQMAKDKVAKWLELPAEQVTVNVTLLGGAFGRKSKPDFVVEAALLAKAMPGRAVKVTWTREDDLQHAYFHTVSVERLEAGLDATGLPIAWLHRSVAPSIGATFGPDSQQQMPMELAMGVINVPFQIQHLRIENPPAAAHTRIGWFRSVTNIPHAFAIQCFVAEIAAATGRDHRQLLLDLIGPPRQIDPRSLGDVWNHDESPQRYPLDTGRLRRVINAVCDQADWSRSLPKGRGLGLAAHYSFLSYVAVVMDVSVDPSGKLTISRVDIAVDCGPQVNPERIRSQLEGACIMGISLATQGEISFKNGQVLQDNFHAYPITRFDEAPAEIRVHLLPVTDFATPLGGVGEPGLPPIAPALCNAIFAACGQRIRQLPIRDQLQKP